MKQLFFAILILGIFSACAQKEARETTEEPSETPVPPLQRYFADDAALNKQVNEWFDQLNDTIRVGQMIVQATGRLGRPIEHIDSLIDQKILGGVLLLNGDKPGFTQWVNDFNARADSVGLPTLVYSADAEPSLVNRKIKGTQEVPKTNALQDMAAVDSIATIINQELLDIGIRHNYAPVVDLSTSNEAITNRSFGADPDRVVELSRAFIQTSQDMGIATTIKHFPGHGLVSGDTHKSLVTIDGELKELDVYRELVKANPISVMIAHLAVINNEQYDSEGLPATNSRKLVTGLLREELGYEGIIITDALNMGALNQFGSPAFHAAKAGCDMVLMPADEQGFVETVLQEMEASEEFRAQIYASVKRILRMKILLAEAGS